MRERVIFLVENEGAAWFAHLFLLSLAALVYYLFQYALDKPTKVNPYRVFNISFKIVGGLLLGLWVVLVGYGLIENLVNWLHR